MLKWLKTGTKTKIETRELVQLHCYSFLSYDRAHLFATVARLVAGAEGSAIGDEQHGNDFADGVRPEESSCGAETR